MIEHILTYQTELLKALGQTGFLLGVSTAMALVVGFPLGTFIYLSRPGGIKENKVVYMLCNAYVNIVRSFPFMILIFAMMPFTRWLLGHSLGTDAASVPLSVIAIAIFARFVEQALLEVPQAIIDTAQSMGATTWQTLRYFIYGEALPGIILGLTSSIIGFISYSTVVGAVGGGGIGDFVMRYGYQQYDYVMMALTVGIIVIFVMLLQYLGTTIAQKIHH